MLRPARTTALTHSISCTTTTSRVPRDLWTHLAAAAAAGASAFGHDLPQGGQVAQHHLERRFARQAVVLCSGRDDGGDDEGSGSSSRGVVVVPRMALLTRSAIWSL